MNNVIKVRLSTNRHFAVLIVIISAVFVIGGYLFYQYEINRIYQLKGRTLASIAILKSNQVHKWFLDEITDVQTFAESPYLDEVARNYIRTNSPADRSMLSGILRQIKIEHDLDDVMLASTDGKVIASASEQIVELDDFEKKSIEAAVNQRQGVTTDLFICKRDGDEMILISFIAVLRDDENNYFAALINRIDPALFLYPIIETWPIPGQTAESFIFRVEADSILILNNLKRQQNTALNLKIPVTQAENTAIKTALGATGIITGKDYSNADVVSYGSGIEATPWFIVSEIDRGELLEEMPIITGRISALVLVLILSSTVSVMFIYNNRQRNIYRQLYNKEKEIWYQHEKFKITMDSLGDGVIIADMEAKVQYMNTRAEELTGWRAREANGRDHCEIYLVKNEETGEKENNILEKVIKHGIVKELANNTLLVSKNGEEIPVMDTGAPVYDADGSLTSIVITFQDETEKRAQSRLLKVSEEKYRMLATHIPQKIFMKNCKLTYIYCNENYAEDLGITPDEIVGKTDYELFPKELADKYRNDDRKILEKEETITFEEEYFVNGNPTWVRTTKTPVKDENGKTTGLLGIFEDITEKVRAHTALMKSEDSLREFFENDITGDYSAIADGELLSCNPAFAGILGFNSPDELVGRNIKEFYRDPFEREEFLKTIQVSKTLKDYEVILKHKGGSDLICKGNIIGVFDESGNLVRYFGYLQDITRQKMAEEKLHIREQLLSSVMNTQQELICRFLPDTTHIFVNKAYCNIFGKTEHELLGRKFLELTPESEWENIFSNLKSLTKVNPQITYESSAFKADGSVMTMEWTEFAIFNEKGEVVEFQSVGRDITEKLKTLNDLIIAKERAEESDKLKTAFINNISHEIRTPLNGILGFGQLLAESDPAAEQRIEMLQHVQQSSTRLMNTVSDYLDMAMLVSDTMEVHRKELVLQPFFEEIIENSKQLCGEKNIDLKALIPFGPADLSIITDSELLSKVLNKLISNAIKFTAQGSISCGYSITQGFAEFFVQDTGRGISDDKLDVIFEMFAQEDPSDTRGFEGSGLGLAITKGMLNLLGGTINVSSEKDKGSTFTFTIPAGDMATASISAVNKATSPQNTNKQLVLIAEDDDLNFLYLESLLELVGCNYLHAVNGAEAVDLCRQNPGITLVLMDIKMPVMNGIEATRLIREFRPELPIIATTAYAQTGDEHRFMEVGYNDYLAKPIKKDDLLEVINKYN